MRITFIEFAGTTATLTRPIIVAGFPLSEARSFFQSPWSAILLFSGSRRALNQREEERAEKKNEQCTACRETRHCMTKPPELILSTFLEILSLKYQTTHDIHCSNYQFSLLAKEGMIKYEKCKRKF